MALRIAVDGAGIEAADDLGAEPQRLVHQLERARPAQQARLREGDDLDVDRCRDSRSRVAITPSMPHRPCSVSTSTWLRMWVEPIGERQHDLARGLARRVDVELALLERARCRSCRCSRGPTSLACQGRPSRVLSRWVCASTRPGSSDGAAAVLDRRRRGAPMRRRPICDDARRRSISTSAAAPAHRADVAAAGGRCGHAMASCRVQRSFGLSASRSQSPSRLTDEHDQAELQRPGTRRSTTSPRTGTGCRCGSACRARAASIGMPTPRKDSVASDRMARPRLSVAATRTGVSVLGRMWRQHDARGRHADDPRRQHIFLAPLDHGRGAHGAGVLHPVVSEIASTRMPAAKALAQAGGSSSRKIGADQDGHQQGRDRQHRVAEPHQQVVDPAAR